MDMPFTSAPFWIAPALEALKEKQRPMPFLSVCAAMWPVQNILFQALSLPYHGDLSPRHIRFKTDEKRKQLPGPFISPLPHAVEATPVTLTVLEKLYEAGLFDHRKKGRTIVQKALAAGKEIFTQQSFVHAEKFYQKLPLPKRRQIENQSPRWSGFSSSQKTIEP
jgi:hypothetical protein